MVKVRPTVTTYSRFLHRDHRSRKGQQKKVIGEIKTDRYFHKVKKSEKILKKISRKEIDIDSLFGPADEIKTGYIEKKPKQQFPKLLCENCGAVIGLKFNPLKEDLHLSNIVCGRCKKPAYWQFYWKAWQLLDFFNNIGSETIRLLIKCGKRTLT